MMRVAVLVKQVPASATLGVDPETGTLIRTNDTLVNPADERALEMALSLADTEITVLSMGPEAAKDMLKSFHAYSIKESVLLCDHAFAGSDTYQTARTLNAALDFLGGFDLILCGRRAVDGETGQVGPEISAMRGVPFVSDAMSMEQTGDRLVVRTEDVLRSREIEVPLPAVVSVCEGASPLRPASILGLRRAAKAEVRVLTNADLALENTGLAGSPTRVKRTAPAEAVRRHTVKIADPEEGKDALLSFWKEDV